MLKIGTCRLSGKIYSYGNMKNCFFPGWKTVNKKARWKDGVSYLSREGFRIGSIRKNGCCTRVS